MRLGISVERSMVLRVEPEFRDWLDAGPPEFDDIFLLVALDESLTRWQASAYSKPLVASDDELGTYGLVVTTPPAQPHWLETLP